MSTATEQNRKELLKAALRRIEDLESRLAAGDRARNEPVAIVGLACRFPGGANDPAAFWRLLREGRDAISSVPRDRWDAEAYYDANPDAPGKSYTREGGFLDEVDRFDADLFGIAPREAIYMDPQQRLLLELTWEAFERAGIAGPQLTAAPTGVFIGLTTSDYSHLQWEAGTATIADAYFGSGVAPSVAAGRIAYTFGLRGPCVTVDTACSSSLVALHLAFQSLKAGECRIALAGGVNLMLSPGGHIVASKGRMLSPTGRCHTFDADADGYVRSEGCGLVVLKRLADAEADGDTVLALVRGSAINQDGKSSGLTAPNGRAQVEVIRQALASAGVRPDQISYVETHGTGTSLGDPIEVQALAEVQGAARRGDPLLMGSVKSNIGHLEAAAGIAGLIKVVLALQHGELPPHLHFRRPNPYIPWDTLPVSVVTAPTPWAAREGRLIAGVSSFGFSGTNAHVILEAAAERPRTERVSPDRPLHVLSLSARTEQALRELAERYVVALDEMDPSALPDVCFTANSGRFPLEIRLAAIADSPEALRTDLESFARTGAAPGVISGRAKKRPAQPVFVFTGQGAQYVGMGRQLFETSPVFRQALLECDQVLRSHLDRPLLTVMFAAEGDPAAEDLLRRTEYAQPAIFSLEWALARLFRSCGIEPAALIGHSIGEYVAACVAGVFPLEDALALVAERGRLMQSLPGGGGMRAVFGPVDRVRAVTESLGCAVSIAAINAGDHVVVSGAERDLEPVVERLRLDGIASKPLQVSHAFHSRLLDPVLPALAQAAARVSLGDPRIDVVSNLTGKLARAGELAAPEYWSRHARQPVLFHAGIETLREEGHDLFIEVGPHPVLSGFSQAGAGHEREETWVSTLRRGRDDWREILTALASLHVRGSQIDWVRFDERYLRRKVALPTYPFQRERFWFDMRPAAPKLHTVRTGEHPLLGRRLRSPKLADQVFEQTLARDTPGFLADHRILENTILPAAAFLEIAAAAARELFGPGSHRVEALAIREPLVLDDGPRVVQTIAGQESASAIDIEICSLSADRESDSWTTHATAIVRKGGGPLAEPDVGEPERLEHPLRTWSADEYYARLRAAGADYGPSFRGLRDIRTAAGRAEATIAGELADASSYSLHPAFLDAAFQLAGAALASAGAPELDAAYAPVRIGAYTVLKPASGSLTAVVRVQPSAGYSTSFSCDVRIHDAEGPVARVEELQFRRAEAEALRRFRLKARQEWLHQVGWEPLEDLSAEPLPARGSWLVLADRAGCADLVVEKLGGRSAALILHAEAIGGDPGEFLQLLEDASREGRLAGAIHLWNLEVPGGSLSTEGLPEAERLGCYSTLHLAQALTQRAGVPLTIVTRGAQAVGGEAHLNPRQALVWGLARVLATEQSQTPVRIIDLDPDVDPAGQAAMLAREILSSASSENQIALRGGRRFAPRLMQGRPAAGSVAPLEPPATSPFTLDITERGLLDRLHLREYDPGPPQAGQVQIRVDASGLNFRDVLNALGMYPGDPGPLGGEVVGTIVAVGRGVTRVAPGDVVMALAPRGFCSLINTAEELVWRKPAAFSIQAAATIPLAFQTAQYALHHVAGIKAGDRVLIHAASGGLGLAAVQVAQRAGAEIFATAGSPDKRAYLRSLGITHVASSRTLDFAESFRRAAGAGLDIVVNSLAGEFISKSLQILKPSGCFLELGKTDLWTEERARSIVPDVRYVPVYLGTVCAEEPERIRRTFQELMPQFESRVLQPLPHVVFPVDRSIGAFRFMAQARHIGKVVVSQRQSGRRSTFRQEGTYLVTGAFGRVGSAVARWMVEKGAGRLVLLGRRVDTREARDLVEELRSRARVVALPVDVADPQALETALAAASSQDAPLRGIVHAAGVLDDGALAQQTAERFARVLAPKVRGAWNLHTLTRQLDLDFFVLCSAGAALFGSPGQSNYAAANAFLDALAHERRLRGLPALSINWGAWAGGGMAGAVTARERERWATQGIGLIDTDAGLDALERLLDEEIAHAAVLPVNWPQFLAAQAGGVAMPLLAAIAQQTARRDVTAGDASGAAAGIMRRLADAPPEDRYDLLAEYVRDQVVHVLALRPDATLPDDRGFSELGMDSLMSVELSNRLKRSLGRSVPATIAFEQPTCAALTRYLAAVLELEERPQLPRKTGRPGLLERVEGLSEDEAERTLAEELERAGY